MRKGQYHYGDGNGELTISDGNIVCFRVTEYRYMRLKDYFAEILERHGRTYGDVLYVERHVWINGNNYRHRFTREQFLKFSEYYEWDTGRAYWNIAGKDFAVTGYAVWYDTFETFTPFEGRPFRNVGIPYRGNNEFCRTLMEDIGEYNPVIRYAVVNGRKPLRITAEAFRHPSIGLYTRMKKAESIGVMTDKGMAVIGMGLDYVADVTLLGDDSYAEAGEDCWGLDPLDSEKRHSWLAERGEKPATEEIVSGVVTAIGRMEENGVPVPRRVSLLEEDLTDCIILFAGSEDTFYDCGLMQSYIQPLFGVFVHVFRERRDVSYFGFGTPLPIWGEERIDGGS